MYSIGQRVIRTADYVSGTVVSAYPYQGTVAYGVRMDNDGDVWSGTEVAWITEDAAPANAAPFFDQAREARLDIRDNVARTLQDGPDAINREAYVAARTGTHTCGTCNGTHSGYAVGSPEYVAEHARMAAYVARGYVDVWAGNPDTDKHAAQDADHAYRAGYAYRMAESNPTGSMPDVPAPWAYRNPQGTWSFLATADDWERGYSDADDAIRTNTDRPVQGYGI